MSNELIHAVRNNDISTIEQLIKQGANVNYNYKDPEVTFNGYTPLHFCIYHKYLPAAQLLLNNGADLEATDDKGNTPFLSAVHLYLLDIDIINLLVQKGANVHAVNRREQNAYDLILDAYHYDRSVDESDHLPNEKEIEVKNAIRRGEGPALTRLFIRLEAIIKNGYDLNGKVSAAFTTLIHIYRNGLPVQVLTWLFENGANPYEVIEETKNPLLIEALNRKLPVDAIVAMINKIGLEHVFESFHNLTPIVIAAGYNNIPLAQKLIEMGADINSQGGRALRTAAENGHFHMIKYLVETGANIQVVDSNGKTPLMVAQQKGFQDIVDYLNQQSGK